MTVLGWRLEFLHAALALGLTRTASGKPKLAPNKRAPWLPRSSSQLSSPHWFGTLISSMNILLIRLTISVQ